jgi:hypothetical protein
MSDSQGSDSQGHANGKALQQGLIVLGLILFGGYLLFDRGLMGVLLEGDKSRLSWLILAIWVAMSGRWLHLLRRMEGDTGPIDEDDMARWLNHGWFAADSVLKIGLLGTIIGFILMLAPIGELTGFDAASLQSALAAMSAGMAVALYTTLAGLSTNIILRFQYQFLADAMQKRLIREERAA